LAKLAAVLSLSFNASQRAAVEQAFGARAGVPITRVGGDPRAPWVCSRAALHAHLDGFDLHAAVAIAASDRPGLERLARYLLRPPIAQDRLEVLDDDRIRVELRSPWSDGTSHLIFEPLELIGRLASFVPRPRSNLVISRRPPILARDTRFVRAVAQLFSATAAKFAYWMLGQLS
jgi:hypothetical protein